MPEAPGGQPNLRELTRAARSLDSPAALGACATLFTDAFLQNCGTQYGCTHGKQGASTFEAGLAAMLDAMARHREQLSSTTERRVLLLLLNGPPAAAVAAAVAYAALLQPQPGAGGAVASNSEQPLVLHALASRVLGTALPAHLAAAPPADEPQVRSPLPAGQVAAALAVEPQLRLPLRQSCGNPHADLAHTPLLAEAVPVSTTALPAGTGTVLLAVCCQAAAQPSLCCHSR